MELVTGGGADSLSALWTISAMGDSAMAAPSHCFHWQCRCLYNGIAITKFLQSFKIN